MISTVEGPISKRPGSACTEQQHLSRLWTPSTKICGSLILEIAKLVCYPNFLFLLSICDLHNVVMVSRTSSQDWTIEPLTINQNGDNLDEVERVRREHPGEPDCVQDQRVLGAIAPFRCALQSALLK